MAKTGDPRRLDDTIRQIHKTLSSIDPHRRDLDIFRDFMSLARLSLRQVANQIAGPRDSRLEEDYGRIRKRYRPEKVELFARALAELATALEITDDDVLGHLFMSLNLGSDYAGQFFTPLPVARMMAELNVGAMEEQLASQPYITMNEPAAGSGVMVIAMAQAMRRRGLNPQVQLKATLMDTDLLCCDMAFVQLSLLGLRAKIIHGDALRMEVWGEMTTPWWWAPIAVIARPRAKSTEREQERAACAASDAVANVISGQPRQISKPGQPPMADRQKIPKAAAIRRLPRAAE